MRAGFLFEPRGERGFRNLQRNVAVELGVAGFPDFPETAFAQLRKKPIAVAELIARLEVDKRRRGLQSMYLNGVAGGAEWRALRIG